MMTPIQQYVLSTEEVLDGYDAVIKLYPRVVPMLLWRSWEYAAYQRYTLEEPVLDIGCGDGRFFRLCWPDVSDVVGVDMDLDTVEVARRSGVYREVYNAPAHQPPVPPETFASAFANCSLEHMDHLDDVLVGIAQSLQAGGTFILSVVTDRFLTWRPLPAVLKRIGDEQRAEAIQDAYDRFHHLTNPFPPEVWVEYLERAGFDVVEHVPMLPEMTGRLFLLFDQLWHVEVPDGEVGNDIARYLRTFERFPEGFRHIFAGLLAMERDWLNGSGAIFVARRRHS